MRSSSQERAEWREVRKEAEWEKAFTLELKIKLYMFQSQAHPLTSDLCPQTLTLCRPRAALVSFPFHSWGTHGYIHPFLLLKTGTGKYLEADFYLKVKAYNKTIVHV